MAIVKSPMFSLIRGTIGQVIYGRTHDHMIVARSKPPGPAPPPSPGQAAIRAFFLQAWTRWTELSEAQRLAWNGYVDEINRYTIPGGPHVPDGRHMYVGLFVAGMVHDETLPKHIWDEPSKFIGNLVLPVVTDITPQGSGNISLNFRNPADGVTVECTISITGPQNLTRMLHEKWYVWENMRKVHMLLPGESRDVTFKGWQAMKRYFWSVRSMSEDYLRTGPPQLGHSDP